MPEWYGDLLASVRSHVATGRRRALASVNSELVLTYWHVGREILDRQQREGYGTRVIDRLSADLREAFPDAKGFSARNLKYMRAFAAAWSELEVVQRSAAQLPWRHHQMLLDKLNDLPTRVWYAQRAVEEGWSRDVLVHHIETRLHQRSGKAVTNFERAIPGPHGELAQQLTKDPYLFDFLSVTQTKLERDLEQALLDQVTTFLLELGQLGFYLAAIDDLLAHPDDEPTIGLVLCRGKNNVVAEYALRGHSHPMGIAEWASQLTTELPADLAASLPSIEELEAELSQPEEDR